MWTALPGWARGESARHWIAAGRPRGRRKRRDVAAASAAGRAAVADSLAEADRGAGCGARAGNDLGGARPRQLPVGAARNRCAVVGAAGTRTGALADPDLAARTGDRAAERGSEAERRASPGFARPALTCWSLRRGGVPWAVRNRRASTARSASTRTGRPRGSPAVQATHAGRRAHGSRRPDAGPAAAARSRRRGSEH